jgi:serine/threonine protein kinase
VSQQTDPWNPNELLGAQLGSCKLERLLGAGGMGAVYLAQQLRPRRQVAVKVLRPQGATDPQAWRVFLARFRREADAAAGLDHANIVPIFEFGQQSRDGDQDGDIAYLVMPYLADGSLAALLTHQGRLSLAAATAYTEQAAAALDYAHQHGIVHRDVKPSNLLLHPDGRLLLADFGIARSLGPALAPALGQGSGQGFGPGLRPGESGAGAGPAGTASDDPGLTQQGTAMGTPEYMAPEQIRGGPVGPAADIYALGIVAYAMLAGQTPFFGGDTRVVLAHQLSDPPPPLRTLRPDISARAEETIFWALAKEPADRPASAGAFAHALRDSGRSRSLSTFFSRGEAHGAQGAHGEAPRGMLRLAAMVAGMPAAGAQALGAHTPNANMPSGSRASAASGAKRPLAGTRPPAASEALGASLGRTMGASGAAPNVSGRPVASAVPAAAVPVAASPVAGLALDDNAPTLADAGTIFPGVPAGLVFPSGAPAWPGGAAPVPAPARHVRRHFSYVKLFAIVTVAVLGFALLLGGLSQAGLFAQTPQSNDPLVDHLPTPTATATPAPTDTPTLPPNWLSASPSTITLSCKGHNRQQTITVQNQGDASVDWHLDASDWGNGLSFSKTHGTIDAGGQTGITVSNNSWNSSQGTITIVPDDDQAGDPASVSYSAQGCLFGSDSQR